MDIIMSVARKYGLIVIEDAAQAIGAQYKGRRAGSIGHYGCFSFFPSKNLGAAGDGGMVVTQESDRADKLKCLRSHGSKPKYHHKIIGGNFRLDALQAAIVTVKLKYLDQWTVARQRNAKNYSELLSDALVPLSNQRFAPVTIPRVKTDRHIFNQYVIRTSRRDQLQDWLKQKKIETEIYYRFLCIFKSVFPTWAMRLARFPRANALRTKPWHFQFTRNSQRTESIMLWDLFGTLSQQIPSHSGPEAPSANGDS
jgi:dTDP-4-amino-4,6-dideoxygalactose transaminase